MIRQVERIGNFTSSGIAALLTTGKQVDGFGVGAITYIAETNMERLLGRSIDTETNSKATAWGKFLEPRVFELLGMDYTYTSKITHVHPSINYWSGSADGTREGKERAIIDIKCPKTLKAFASLTMPLFFGLEGNAAIKAVREGFEHEGIKYPAAKDGEKYYWQLVSNACIHGLDYAELIVYMPYQSELLEIKKLADGNPSMYWMNYAEEDEIPYLPDGGPFRNLNVIRFKVPQEDKELLTAVVLKAGKHLVSREPLTKAA